MTGTLIIAGVLSLFAALFCIAIMAIAMLIYGMPTLYRSKLHFLFYLILLVFWLLFMLMFNWGWIISTLIILAVYFYSKSEVSHNIVKRSYDLHPSQNWLYKE